MSEPQLAELESQTTNQALQLEADQSGARIEPQTEHLSEPQTDPRALPQTEPQAAAAEKTPQATPEAEPQAASQMEVTVENKPKAVPDRKTPQAVPQTEVSTDTKIEASDTDTLQAVLPEKTVQAPADDKTEALANDQTPQPEAPQLPQKTPIICKPCKRKFEQQSNYENHLIHSPRHFYCKPCKRDFVSDDAKRAHLAHAKAHRVCKWCKDEEIINLELHNRCHHWECTRCKILFEDNAKRHAHYRAVHSKIYCGICYRIYKNRNDLKMHNFSHRHQYRNLTCPFPECHGAFLSESGVLAHLESGCCASGADQAMIDKSMVIRDPKQIFIRQARVALPEEREIPAGRQINPCPLCPKKFHHRAGLLQHLGSSKHTNNGRDPYKCPAATCKKATFPSLSSLFVHKERGKCGLDQDTLKIALLDRYLYDLFDRIRNM